MKLTRSHLRRLVLSGAATEEGLMSDGYGWPEGTVCVIVTRHDIWRTDHYEATAADIARLSETAEQDA